MSGVAGDADGDHGGEAAVSPSTTREAASSSTSARGGGKVVDAKSVSIARRPVPVIAWSTKKKGAGYGAGYGTSLSGGVTSGVVGRGMASSVSDLRSARDRLAAFEERFGAPEKVQSLEYTAGGREGEAGAAEEDEPRTARVSREARLAELSRQRE